MTKNDTFGLICSGGGAHGAYQVGVLKYIHEKFSENDSSPFRIFAGSSCGALNTSFYAAQSHDALKSSLWLEDLWMHFHVPSYHGNIVKNSLKNMVSHWKKKKDQRFPTWSLLSPAPMKEVIIKGFLRENLETALKNGTTLGVAIAATEMVSGRCCWFQEGEAAGDWNLFHSIGIKTRLEPHHLEASCSVPFVLPPVKIGPHYYLDGSVGLERPIASAIIMGATRVMNIATDLPALDTLPDYPAAFTPRFTNTMRLVMNRFSRDPAKEEAEQIQMLNRVYWALSRNKKKLPFFRDHALPAHYKPVNVYMFYPSKRIRDYYGLEKNDGSRPKRTRFMFESRFIRQLIDMGYQDAHSRHNDLKDFFVPESSRKRIFFRRHDSHDRAA